MDQGSNFCFVSLLIFLALQKKQGNYWRDSWLEKIRRKLLRKSWWNSDETKKMISIGNPSEFPDGFSIKTQKWLLSRIRRKFPTDTNGNKKKFHRESVGNSKRIPDRSKEKYLRQKSVGSWHKQKNIYVRNLSKILDGFLTKVNLRSYKYNNWGVNGHNKITG